MATIFWAGDSTVQYNDILTFPQTGIGQVMNLFLKPEVRVENHAKNGRSTKSFIDESRLTPIYDKITAGDFLFIQFGHNDEKKNDPQRYTEMRKAGAEKTKEWYMHLPAGVYPSHMDGLTDNTHLKYMGAVVYAGCIARGLKELGGIYSDLLVAWE